MNIVLQLRVGKTAKKFTNPGAVSGCDFAGVVEELGPGAEAAGVKGERKLSHHLCTRTHC